MGSKGKATAFKTEFNKLVWWESEGKGQQRTLLQPLSYYIPTSAPSLDTPVMGFLHLIIMLLISMITIKAGALL